MPNIQPSPFKCPGCGAKYKVVRDEVPSESLIELDMIIACKVCDGPLDGRVGNIVLKYFLVDRPRLRRIR